MVWLGGGAHSWGWVLFGAMTGRFVEAVVDAEAGPRSDCRSLSTVNDAVQTAETWYDLLEGVKEFLSRLKRAEWHGLLVLDDFDSATVVLSHLSEYQLLRDIAADAESSVGL